MLNLKDTGAKDHITVMGAPFFLYTDYRVWINYPDDINRVLNGEYELLRKFFIGPTPPLCQETIEEMTAFYYQPREIPRSKGSEPVLDYEIDADYIYAAFMQAYGIDIIDTKLHWHKFQALISALPESTMMVKIMQYRGYNGNSKDPGYKDYMELKQAWALPIKFTEEEMKQKEQFDTLFT